MCQIFKLIQPESTKHERVFQFKPLFEIWTKFESLKADDEDSLDEENSDEMMELLPQLFAWERSMQLDGTPEPVSPMFDEFVVNALLATKGSGSFATGNFRGT